MRLQPLILALLLLLVGCDVRRNWDAALLLADISAGTGPSRLKDTTVEPRRTTVVYAVEDQSYQGDVYLPGGAVRTGVVVVPGAAEDGKDDQRLVAFATSLARADIAVLVPDLPSLRQLEVHSGNVGEIKGALQYLVDRPELAPNGRIGLVAFSYAAGPAVLAVRESAGALPVAVLMTIGGYYSLPDVLTFITTGEYFADGAWQHMTPHPYGKWVLVQSNLRHLDDVADRNLFRSMIERKKADLDAPIEDLGRHLGPQGQTLYRFISNRDRTRVAELYAALPAALRAEVERLDLAGKDLTGLPARLLLVHGYDDTIIPYTESAALAKSLPEGLADLFLVDGLMHVDASPGLLGRWRMWRAMAAFLTVREEDPVSRLPDQ